jgi:hypothetical protein
LQQRNELQDPAQGVSMVCHQGVSLLIVYRFHDHQMIESRKDALGTEMLSVPFRKEELETILEDIMS